MYKRDHLLKQFEEFGKALALILGHKKQKEWEKFDEKIKESFKTFVSKELTFFESLADEQFLEEIQNEDKYHSYKRKIIAALLFERMIFYYEHNKIHEADQLREKCLMIYELINQQNPHGDFDLDLHYKLNYLKSLK